MKCPECGCEESKVIDSRPTENKVRRRRECIQCGFRFTTYEIIEDIPLMVIKKDNSIEPFDRQKLVDRLCRAAVKRPVKLETIENMVDEIAAELKNSLQREVTSEKIGEMVLHKLKAIDVVAYIRFAPCIKTSTMLTVSSRSYLNSRRMHDHAKDLLRRVFCYFMYSKTYILCKTRKTNCAKFL